MDKLQQLKQEMLEMKCEFPEIENDMYDLGYKDCWNNIYNLLTILITQNE